eukprot:6466677-Pyramimonas_sp.AAC.1
MGTLRARIDKHKPNSDATRALQATLSHHAVLVHGPPGTGKTTFSVTTQRWTSQLWQWSKHIGSSASTQTRGFLGSLYAWQGRTASTKRSST